MKFKPSYYTVINSLKSFFTGTKPNKIDLFSEHMREYNSCRPSGPDKRYCFAPFKNLYFGQDGEVASCCAASYVSVYGFYPVKSIKQLWESSAAYKMRAAVHKGYLEPTCHLCYRQIEEKNFDVTYSHVYEWAEINKQYPVMMEFYLGNNCNLECIMCSAVNSSGIALKNNISPKKSPYDDDFVRQLEEFIPYLKQTYFFGGEPFLIPVYYKIWQKITEINPECRIDITTNGTIFNEKIQELLKKVSVNFIISLDSLQKENFEKIRKKASFETVMENFYKFLQYSREKNTRFYISFNPMQQNWKEIPDILSFANELNIGIIFNRVWEPPQCALWNWDYEKLIEIYKYLNNFTFTDVNEIQKYNNKSFEVLKSQIYSWSLELEKYNKNISDYQNISVKELLANELNNLYKANRSKLFIVSNDKRNLLQRQKKINAIIDGLKFNDHQNNKLKQFVIMQKEFAGNTFYYSDFKTVERVLRFATGN